MNSPKCFKIILFSFFAFLLSSSISTAALNPANFTSDLDQLVLDGNNLVASIESITLSSSTMSNQLASLEFSVQSHLNSVGDVYKTVVASTDNTTMSLTNEMLIPLQTLATISASLTQSLGGLSAQMAVLASTTSLTALNDSLVSMLRLSDDIGVMADRILEMSDQILIMADNIGIMADRILATQVIQSDNLKVIVDASLETQKNILMLFSMFNL